MRHFIILFFLILQSGLLFAQSDFRSGYIITNEGDTLEGLVDYRSEKFNAQQCNFKADSNSAIKTYYPKDIYGYRINDSKYYRTRNVAIDSVEKSLFLELLVDGIADLYYTHPDIYFIESEERGMQILKNTTEVIVYNKMNYGKQTSDDVNGRGSEYYRNKHEYIAFLKIYFQDQVALWDDIERADFSHKDLINITTEYHNMVCPDEECIVYSKSDINFKFRFNFFAGVAKNTLELYSYNRMREIIPSASREGLIFGAEIEPYRTGLYERFYPKISLAYAGFEYIDTETAETPYSVKFNTLNIGLSLNYIYPKYRLKPFLGGGFLFRKAFLNDESWAKVPALPYDSRRNSFSFMLLGGLTYQINESIGIKAEIDYAYEFSHAVRDDYYDSEMQLVYFQTGVVFYLQNKN